MKNKKMILAILLGVIIIVVFIMVKFKSNDNNNSDFFIRSDYEEIKVGEYQKIDYFKNEELGEITWSSDDEDVVKIDDLGTMYGVKTGIAMITGKIITTRGEVSDNIAVSVYMGDKNIKLEDVEIPNGNVLMRVNTQFDIPFIYTPSNAYINLIKYEISDNNIIELNDDKIIAKNVGVSELKVIVNGNYQNSIMVNVTDQNIENKIVKEAENLKLSDDEISIKVGEKRKIDYTVTPSDAYIYSTKWDSMDSSIVSVLDGEITGLKSGKTTVNFIVNDKVSASVIVNVSMDATGLNIKYYPKRVIKVGESTNVIAHILPENASDQTITYKSSNPAIAMVDNGTITGVNSGSAIITLSAGGKTISIDISVLPRSGTIDGTGNLYGYKSLNAKVPVLADNLFFQRLAQNGVGIFHNGTYRVSSGSLSFTYDTTADTLYVDSQKILVRIYYPPNEDLSTLNTLVYMGGRGEKNFYSVFADAKKNPSIIKSGGIVALLAEGGSFNGASGAYVTKFLKTFTNQKSGVKNSILGFSDGAHQVLQASLTEVYDKIIIFSGYAENASSVPNAKNSEVIFMVAPKDGNYNQAVRSMNSMRNAGYTNLTMVSNGTDLSKYSDKCLIIHPGNLMKNGHLSENVLNSGIIEYAND